MHRFALVLALLAAASLPRISEAEVIVSYGFDSLTSTLAITSPLSVAIPPQGSFEGIIEITFTSDVAGAIVDGPATLNVFNLDTDLNIATNFLGPVTLVGPASAELEDPVAGNLVGNTLSFAGAQGSFHAFGSLTCGGAICAAGGFTPGMPRAFDGSASVALPALTLASIHGTLAGLTFTVGGLSVVASLTFNGEETGREIVPEPAVALLLALAAGALVVRRR